MRAMGHLVGWRFWSLTAIGTAATSWSGFEDDVEGRLGSAAKAAESTSRHYDVTQARLTGLRAERGTVMRE
jgi:hypothetical protein